MVSLFLSEKVMTFLVIAKIFRLSLGCHPLDNVIRGVPPLPPVTPRANTDGNRRF